MNPPKILIIINGIVNIPLSNAIIYAHTQIGINNMTDVISPGENFRLTIVVPIWANKALTVARPTNK